MANIDDLRTLAQQIKNETTVGANTANRVGTTFEKTVTELETIEGNVAAEATDRQQADEDLQEQIDNLLPSKDESISYNESILTIDGYGLDITDGTPKALYSNYKISDYIEIPIGTHTIQYSGLITASMGYIPVCIYDENKEYLYGSKSSAYTIPVLNNAKYVRVAGTTAAMQLVFTYRNISEFDNIKGYVLQCEFDINIAHLSGLITTSGAITTGGGYSVSIPFSIKDFDKVSFTLTSVANSYCSIFFYNKEGDELVPIKGFKTIGTYEYDVSYFGDDVYVRISYGYVTVQLKKEKVGIEEKLEDCVNTEEFTSLSERLYGEEEQHTKTYDADSVELTFESGALLKAGGFDNQTGYKHSNLIPITKDVLSIEYTNAFSSENSYCGVQLYAGDDLIAVNVPSGNGTFLMSEYPSATSVRFMTAGGCYLTFTIFNKGDINYLQEEIDELSGKGSGTNIVGHTRNKVAYFFGDSLTRGAFGGGYVGRVKLKLGLNTAENYGVNGATAGGVKEIIMDSNKDYSICDIVCIMVGTNHRGMTNAGDIEKDIPKLCLTSLASEDYPYTYNDSSTTVQTAVLDNENDYFTELFPSTFIGQVSACVEYVQYKNPYCRIYLIAPYITAIGTEVHDAIPIVREALLEIGARYGVPVIDVCGKCNINDKTAATYLNANDGVHPTAAANIAMANYISRYISLDYIEPWRAINQEDYLNT